MKLTEAKRKRFDALYRQHHQEVFRACLRFAARDRDWAIDRAQDVFVTLAKHISGDELDDVEHLGGWIYRVAINACLMDIRRRGRWRRVVERVLWSPAKAVEGPERTVQMQRDSADLEAAMRKLPENQYALVVLMHFDGKSQGEAAQILGFSKGHASKLYAKAIETLRKQEWEVAYAG